MAVEHGVLIQDVKVIGRCIPIPSLWPWYMPCGLWIDPLAPSLICIYSARPGPLAVSLLGLLLWLAFAPSMTRRFESRSRVIRAGRGDGVHAFMECHVGPIVGRIVHLQSLALERGAVRILASKEMLPTLARWGTGSLSVGTLVRISK